MYKYVLQICVMYMEIKSAVITGLIFLSKSSHSVTNCERCYPTKVLCGDCVFSTYSYLHYKELVKIRNISTSNQKTAQK